MKINSVVLDHTVDPSGPPEIQAEFSLALLPYTGNENGSIPVRIQRTGRIDQTLTVDWAVLNASGTPASGTETFLPNDVSKNFGITTGEVGPSEVGTFQLFNPQYVSGPASDPILGSPSSAPFIIVDLNNPTKRWNYGHYVRINGNPVAVDQNQWWTDAFAIANANLGEPQFVGMVCGIAWRALEPTVGNYDWTRVYQLLDICAAHGNKKLILLPTYKSFTSSIPSIFYHVPGDLQSGEGNNVYRFGNNTGYCGAIWRDGTGGFDDLRGAFANMLVALVAEFDAHPNFEGLSQVEAITSLTTGAPPDHTNLQIYNSLSYIWQQVAAAVDKINYMPMHNTLGEYTAQIVEDFYQLEIMMGSPDAREVTGYQNFEGIGSIGGRDYRYDMGCFTMATHSVLVSANYDPDFIINNEQGHATTHLAWDVWITQAGKTKADILAAIDADPLLNSGCPTIYPACEAG